MSEKLEVFAAPIIQKLGIQKLNTIQVAMWDAVHKEQDVVLLAPTGSGKTLAFLLPVMAKLQKDIQTIQALIIAPTRELAIQIFNVSKDMKTGVSITLCYGGHPILEEKKSLANNPQLVVATPGRCNDHIRKGNLKIDSLAVLVCDEFDKSLELGFQDDIKDIVRYPRSIEQYLMTSATAALSIPSFVGIKQPIKLDYINEHKTSGRLKMYKVVSPDKDKLETLGLLLRNLGNESSLVFLNYRDAVERVFQYVNDQGIDAEFFHGGLDQKDRERKLLKFRQGSIRVLVTTDLSARGLDIPLVKNVIHYQLPNQGEQFVHRNGRTARMEATGNAFVLTSESELLKDYLPQEIEVFGLRQDIEDPPQVKWVSIELNRGKKDKVSKMDVLGFLTKIGGLKGSQVGNISIQNLKSYAAIERLAYSKFKGALNNKKIKGKSVKVALI